MTEQAKKSGSRLSSLLIYIREGCFSLDLYGYTPSLIVSEYKTFISLFASFVILTAFTLAVVYTSYIWVVGNLNQTESDEVHDESLQMLPSGALHAFGDMPLPQFGVILLLGNGTFVNWGNSSAFKVFFQQSVVCNSDATNKVQDFLPQAPCTFQESASSSASANITTCAAWDTASTSLVALNNTASNPCKIPLDTGEAYSVPRVVGTFYGPEYSYITATVSVNTSLLASQALVNVIAKGSMQVFISFNFFSPSNFAQGIVQPVHNRVWSRRINLFPNVTLKAEVLMRPRLTTIHNYWWDVPSLQKDVIDYLPFNVESYVAIAGSTAPNWTDIGKVYLRFDDRDMMIDLFPPQDALALLSGWGGFLSILLVVGTPAVIINRLIFQHKIKKLISEDMITFDEGVRTNRSQAVTKSYVQGGGKSIMTKSRRTSVFGFLATGSQNMFPSLQRASAGAGTGTPPLPAEPAPALAPDCLAPVPARRPKLSFLDPDLSHSSPSLLQSPLLAGVVAAGPSPLNPASSHTLQASVSFPTMQGTGAAPPTPSFASGLFSGAKVHAEPRPAAAPPAADLVAPAAEPSFAPAPAAGLSPAPSASRTVPDDEPLFPPMPASDDAALPAASTVVPADAAAAPAEGAGPEEAPPLAPGADADAVSEFGPAALASVTTAFAARASPDDSAALLAPAATPGPQHPAPAQPLGESTEVFCPGRPAVQAYHHPLQQPASEFDLPEQGWGGGAKPRSSRRFLQGARPAARCACCPETSAAPLRMAGKQARPSWGWEQPGSGGRGVCEQSETSGVWSQELSGGYQGRTFKMDDDADVPGPGALDVDHQVASMAVKYDGDCFADDDEDENYEDVVRHATSECNALFHLRQVVKLVQRDSPFLTLWGDHLTVHQQEVVQRKQDRSVHRALSRTGSRAGSRVPLLSPDVEAEAGQLRSAGPQGAAESTAAATDHAGLGADGAVQQHWNAFQTQQNHWEGSASTAGLVGEGRVKQDGSADAADAQPQPQQVELSAVPGAGVKGGVAAPASLESSEIKSFHGGPL